MQTFTPNGGMGAYIYAPSASPDTLTTANIINSSAAHEVASAVTFISADVTSSTVSDLTFTATVKILGGITSTPTTLTVTYAIFYGNAPPPSPPAPTDTTINYGGWTSYIGSLHVGGSPDDAIVTTEFSAHSTNRGPGALLPAVTSGTPYSTTTSLASNGHITVNITCPDGLVAGDTLTLMCTLLGGNPGDSGKYWMVLPDMWSISP